MTRLARASDRGALLALWRDTFGDSEAFLDWFFSERWLPEHCVVEERGGEIIGAMHGIPARIAVRGVPLPGVIVSGVATRPEYRGRGVMHAVFSHFMREHRSAGFSLVCCHPARLPTYFSLGLYPSADAAFFTGGPAPAAAPPARLIPPGQETPALLACYRAFSARYSAVIDRGDEDLALKMRDYASDGAQCLALSGEGGIESYAVFFRREGGVYAEECAAREPSGFPALLAALAGAAGESPVTAKLPPELSAPDGWRAEVKPWTVMGALDVPALIRAAAAGTGDFSVQVRDDVLPQNSGVFGPDGGPASLPPALRLSAGRLTQWLTGYRSLEELLRAGDAEALDPARAAALDAALPRLPCWMVDEY